MTGGTLPEPAQTLWNAHGKLLVGRLSTALAGPGRRKCRTRGGQLGEAVFHRARETPDRAAADRLTRRADRARTLGPG